MLPVTPCILISVSFNKHYLFNLNFKHLSDIKIPCPSAARYQISGKLLYPTGYKVIYPCIPTGYLHYWCAVLVCSIADLRYSVMYAFVLGSAWGGQSISLPMCFSYGVTQVVYFILVWLHWTTYENCYNCIQWLVTRLKVWKDNSLHLLLLFSFVQGDQLYD